MALFALTKLDHKRLNKRLSDIRWEDMPDLTNRGQKIRQSSVPGKDLQTVIEQLRQIGHLSVLHNRSAVDNTYGDDWP